MRRILSRAIFVAVVLSSASVLAQDANLRAALYDIERAESQMPSLTPSRKANILRVRRSLAGTEQRLQASSDKSSPAWQDASVRLEKLKQALAALETGGAPAAAAPQQKAPAQSAAPTAPAAKTAPSAAATANPDIDRAVRGMNLLDRQMRGQRSVSQRDAKKYLTELYRIGKGLAAADRAHPSWKPAAATYQKLNTEILDINVSVIDAKFKKVADRIGKMQLTQYMLAAEVDPVRKSLAGVYGDAKGLGSPKHAGLQNLVARIEKVGDAFEARVKTAIAERSKYGDVDAQVAQVHKRVYEIKVPTLNGYPKSDAQIQKFAKDVEAVKQHIATDGAYLASIDGKVPMTVERRNAFNNAKNQLQFGKPKDLEQSLAIATETIDRFAADQETLVVFFEKTDPNDANHRANRLLGKGKFEEGIERLATARRAIQMTAVYDQAMKRSGAPDRAAQLARVNAATAAFKAKFESALGTARMPKATSTSEALHKVVAEVFARPKYGYKAERVVINTPLKSYEKETGSISRSSITTSTVTVYKYKWDQFQAFTAEKVGDVYYMYANTFKFYHAADPTTSTQTWILSDRFQSSRILKENIGK